MPRTTRWRDLVPGLLALGTIAAVAVGVLLFARVGALRGDTFSVVVLAAAAHDIESGTDVWLAGQRVGTVTDVTFRPPSTDTTRRLLVRLELLERAHPLLRRDSRVDFRAGGSLLGARVVALAPGTPDAPPLAPGDTLLAAPDRDLQGFASAFADVGEQLPVLQGNVDSIVTSLRAADGSLGAARRAGGIATVAGLQRSLVSLTRQLSGADDGSLGPILRSGDLRARARRAAARADSVRLLLVSSDRGSVGRFRRDSSLAAQIAAVRDEVSTVRALLDLPAGSAGRALHDGAVTARLGELERELGLLLSDVKRRPLRYIVF